jgi:hypothetical protein
MHFIARYQQPSRMLSGGEQHAVLSGIWRPIRHTVLRGVNIDAGTQSPSDVLSRCPVNDFLNRKVRAMRLFLMQKRSCDKDLSRTAYVDCIRRRWHLTLP